ncbi:MAG: pilus assembly protein PilM [Aquifex sp.]|nr:MAG: pilus assembly protein PilM [Aquifex sp.]
MKLLEKLKKRSFKLPSLSFSPKTSLSIFLTPEFLRIMEIDKEGNPTFDPVEIDLSGKSEVERLNLLIEKVNELGIKGKVVHTCITARNGILKVQKFPSTLGKKELKEAIDTMITIEKENLKEESIYDYFIQETEDGKFKIVYLVLVRKIAYENIRRFLEGAGLKLGIIDYEITTLVNAGFHFNLRIPFAILYIDFHESIFLYYTGQSLTYNVLNFSFREYLETQEEFMIEDFFVEVKNQLIINEVSTLYLAGKAIENDEILDKILTNLPVLSPLEPPNASASFLIPYILCMRGFEG